MVPILTGLTEEPDFLLSPDLSVHLLGRVQICNLKATIFCTLNGVSVELLLRMYRNWLLLSSERKMGGRVKSGSLTIW